MLVKMKRLWMKYGQLEGPPLCWVVWLKMNFHVAVNFYRWKEKEFVEVFICEKPCGIDNWWLPWLQKKEAQQRAQRE